MGNHRSVITKETMGIPVIAIGVPTVVDAATIVNDTMENFIAALETSETFERGRSGIAGIQFCREIRTGKGTDRTASERNVCDTERYR